MELIFSIAGGLVVALVFQLMLANFGLALGLTTLDWSPVSSRSASSPKRTLESANEETSAADAQSEFSLPVTHLLGFGVASSLSIVIFAAALLSAEFSQIVDPRRGAIFGLIFWGTYWLLFIWLSSSTAVSVADSVLGGAIAGGRQLVSTLQQALSSKGSDQSADEKADAAIAQQSLIKSLAAEISQVADVQQALPELLAQQKESLLAEIGDRTQLSSEQIADLLKEIKPAQQKSSQPKNLDSSSSLASSPSTSPVQSSLLSRIDWPDWKQVLKKVLDDQIDLSDFSLKGLWQQLPAISDSHEVKSAHKTIQQVAEAYIRYAPSWALQPEALEEVFTEQLYDSKAVFKEMPEQVIEQLSTVDHERFTDWLQERKDLSVDRVEAIATQLSDVPSKLAAALSSNQQTQTTEQNEQKTDPKIKASVESKSIQGKLIAYCRYTNLDILTPEALTEKIQSQLQEHSINDANSLSIDVDAISDVVSRRSQIAPAQSESLIKTLKSILPTKPPHSSHQPQFIKNASALTVHTARSLPEQISKQVSRYLRHQEKSAFHPEQIAKDIAQIVAQAVGGALSSLPHPSALLDRLQESEIDLELWDKSLWENELTQRRDMTTDEIQQILEWGESAWKLTAQKIGSWIKVIQHQVSDLVPLLEGDFGGEALKENFLEGNFLEEARQQIVEQISSAQAKLEAQADAVKIDVQRRADAVRGQVAIATWWLFSALLLSGIAAGSAGWLAAVY
ncbi:MAG: hypothetical protein WBA76_15775 [Phormidesmis sp.]